MGIHLRHIDVATAIAKATKALINTGASRKDATAQAKHLVEGELRGHPSHGLRRLPTLVGRINNGLLDPAATPTLEWTATSALTVDGNNGFGPTTAYTVIDALASRAEDTGIALAALHRTHHLGILAPYLERLAGRGLIGLISSSTEGLVHPWGGAGALLGTTPLGIGIPTGATPIILDMSTGAVSAGKILELAERNLPIPSGWAVDEDGQPTTDAIRARDGAISPFGGAKGYALGIALAAIVGELSGTAYGPEVHGTLDRDLALTKGDIIMVIRPGSFSSYRSDAALSDYLDVIRASSRTADPVTIPGDRARSARDDALIHGFDVRSEVWDTIATLAGDRPGQEVGTRS